MTALKTFLFVLPLTIASSIVNAEPINTEPTGLTNPQSTLDFGASLYADHTPVTNQFQGDGVTFSTNGDSWLYRTFTCSPSCLANGIEFGHLIGGGVYHTTFSIHFNASVTDAAFIFRAFPKPWTLTSWLEGQVVESFTFTAAGEGNSTIRTYGFKNSVFDTLTFVRTQPDTSGFEFDNFQYSFLTAEDQISDIINVVIEMNVHAGISNALDAKLDTVLNALEDANTNNDIAAVNALYAFCSSVDAQRDKKLTGTQADQLITAANGIISTLDSAYSPCQ